MIRKPESARVAARSNAGSGWAGKYGHGVWALETFVDRSRFTGACYRAANWRKVGHTTGRTRNDIANRGPLSSVKDVYLYALGRGFPQALRTPARPAVRAKPTP